MDGDNVTDFILPVFGLKYSNLKYGFFVLLEDRFIFIFLVLFCFKKFINSSSVFKFSIASTNKIASFLSLEKF